MCGQYQDGSQKGASEGGEHGQVAWEARGKRFPVGIRRILRSTCAQNFHQLAVGKRDECNPVKHGPCQVAQLRHAWDQPGLGQAEAIGDEHPCILERWIGHRQEVVPDKKVVNLVINMMHKPNHPLRLPVTCLSVTDPLGSLRPVSIHCYWLRDKLA